jgi:hypothetical protein
MRTPLGGFGLPWVKATVFEPVWSDFHTLVQALLNGLPARPLGSTLLDDNLVNDIR